MMHIALIPDGNRRFMSKKGITSLFKSYNMGITRFYDFLEWCLARDVSQVTIYALSTENIQNRSPQEIDVLFKVFTDQAKKSIEDRRIHENQIKIKVCGSLDMLREKANNKGLAEDLIESLEKLEESTKDYNQLQLNLAIAYGGRQEILHAVKEATSAGEDLTEENLKNRLWIPDYPELIIRTSEERLSNFLTWQSAYSEIYFVDKLWQEFEQTDLDNILENYNQQDRRFGR
ncbi:MAG: polyprenyl diphosphate synthase [Candidatus Altiarchaeota archaeon]